MGHPSPPPGKPRFSAPKVYGAKPRSPQGASGASSPVLTGLIVAALYSVVWTLLVYVVHNPVSLAGWGAGGLIGIALARAAGAPTPSLGTLAVVRALMAFELQDRIIAEAGARDSAATPAKRERLVRTYSDQILGRAGFLA